MAFNFDSESNAVVSGTPAAKAINKLFCMRRGPTGAGIWIADENMEKVSWRRECLPECSSNCEKHYVGTEEHYVATPTSEIPGRGVVSPRMLILGRTSFLKMSNPDGRYMGAWRKGDGDVVNDDGSKKFSCAIRYMIIFLDKDNKPLHSDPIQLTAKGNFMYHFNNKLNAFRDDMSAAYAKSMGRRNSKMSDTWYAMCVFCPVFESKLVGQAPKTSNACVTSGYAVPTEQNWKEMCVGRDPEMSERVILWIGDLELWRDRYQRPPSPKTDNDFNDSVSNYSG